MNQFPGICDETILASVAVLVIPPMQEKEKRKKDCSYHLATLPCDVLR